jgi:hypothetical protein
MMSYKDLSNTYYQNRLKVEDEVGREYIFNDMSAVVFQVLFF